MKLGDIAKAKRNEAEDAITSLFDWFESEGLEVDRDNMTASLNYGTGVIDITIEDNELVIENEKEEEIVCGQDLSVSFCPPFNRDLIHETLLEMMGGE